MAPETKREGDERFLREWQEDMRRAAQRDIETAEWYGFGAEEMRCEE